MAISYVSSTSANAATATALSVQVGDLIVVLASRYADATIPSLPAGWTSLATISAGGRVGRLGYKIATTAGAQSIGTWTGAQYVAVGVWRGAGAPSKSALQSGGTPALSGLATNAWIGMLAECFGFQLAGEVVSGLTERNPPRVYDSAGPMSSRSAATHEQIYVAALFEIPPGGVTGDLATAVPGPPVMDWAGTSVNPAALDTTVAGPVAADWSGTSINPATLDATVPGPPALDWAGQSVNPAVLDAVVSGPPVVAWTGTQAGSILHAEVPGPPTMDWAGTSINPATLDAVVPGLVASIDGTSINPGTLTATTPGPPVADMPGTSINPAALDATAPVRFMTSGAMTR